MDIGYDIVKILLASVIPIMLGAILYNPIKRKCEARRAAKAKRAELEESRDALLKEVARIVRETSGDVRCLYSVQRPMLESLEISLLKIQGSRLNGNVKDAIDKVRAAKDKIDKRLTDKVGANIGEAD
jgi:hypothetical protein